MSDKTIDNNDVFYKEDMSCFNTRIECDDDDCTKCPNYKEIK